MRELREDSFFRNKNDDAHEHVERVLDNVSLLNILRVSHDVVMLRVFPITLTGAGDSPINKVKCYWESINDSKREELEWENLSLNDWMKIRYGKVCKMTRERVLKDHWRERFEDEENDLEENFKDPEECEEDKANAIMGAIHDKLNDDWFNNISEDEDDLEGILDYLEPRSYDGFIDLDDEF
nr:hypothetical protein [Tanacetum cinerariifolium]